MELLSDERFALHVLTSYLLTDCCQNIAEQGPIWLTETHLSAGMICHYLFKSSIPINAENVTKEIMSITQTVLARQVKDNCAITLPETGIKMQKMMITKIEMTRWDSELYFDKTIKNGNDGYYRKSSLLMSFDGGKLYFQSQKYYGGNKWTHGAYVYFKLDQRISFVDA